MLSPLIENSRIAYALRNAEQRGLRIYEPQELVREAFEQFGDQLCVSCSFGSCSVVVLHMALQVNPKIKVVFNNTGVEYPETYAYRDLLVKDWKLNLIETKPLKSFWQCWREYGPPLTRSQVQKQEHRPYDRPMCCIYCKEKPMAKACKEYNVEATLTGLRSSESSVRMFTIGQRGQFYETKKWGKLTRAHPIAHWPRSQVMEYFKQNNIDQNEVYTKLGLERSGCMPCTGFINWEKQLAKANPKMYRYVQKLRKVPLLDDYIQREDQILNECRPSELLEVSQ